MIRLTLGSTGRLALLAALLAATVILAGWIATGLLCDQARQEVIREGDAAALTVSIHLNSERLRIRGGVRALAGSPWIAPALTSRRPIDLEHANSVLDRYNASLDATVSYMMDPTGLTVAASNRNEAGSYVGRSHAFRRYVRDALGGLDGEAFALGHVSGKRSYFAASPVRDGSGRIIGVAAMKRDLDLAEAFVSQYPHCYFVDPNGIIFLASRPEMVFRSLWPVPEKTVAAIWASRQFGIHAFEPVFPGEVHDDMQVSLDGEDYIAARSTATREGWSVVVLNSTHRIEAFRMAGIATTAAVLALFSAVLYVTLVVSRSRQAIAYEEQRFRELFGNMSSGVLVCEAGAEAGEFTIRDVNRAAERISRVGREDLVGRRLADAFPGARDLGLLDVVDRVRSTGAPERMDTSLYRDERMSLWVENYVYRLPNGEVVVVFDDVSERRRAEEALQKSEEKYREILENMQEAYVETGLGGEVTFFNPAICALLGYSAQEMTGRDYRSLLHEDSRPGLAAASRNVLGTGVSLRLLEYRLMRKDGIAIHVETSLMLRRGESGAPVGFSGIARDITERKRLEEELRMQSVSDAMTGLYNRRGFMTLAERQMKVAARSRMEIVLLFADMDGLKAINDHLGHRKGDEAIVEAAAILREAFRETDIIARVGGDEFVVLALGASLVNSAVLTNRFEQCIESHNAREGRDYRIGISIGLVQCNPEEFGSIDEMMTRADALMYEQKKQRKAERAS